ncbi:prephenate dehydratase [Candidatus Sumerlaeota bacterium]|nr:prephenate dehydratase [Candidatus Sumerlaeota bacterium]
MNIETLRKRIDKYDREIIGLLNKRAEAAVAIGKVKARAGRAYFDAGRQKMILDRLCKMNEGVFPNSGLRHVYTEIMSACLNLESQLTIGFLGPEATFSHVAAMELFGTSGECIPYKTVDDVFMACEKEWTHYGVVPIENSAGGVVHRTLDRFVDTNLIICGEITLSIHQVLMANCPLPEVKRVYSHAQAFLQCRSWLKENLPSVDLREVDSTSEGAKMAARYKHCAAIANEMAARLYDLKVLVRGVEDIKDNFTRFWVIGRSPAAATGDDKTSIMFSVKDRPGALYDLLKPFHDKKINLTKIESRPTKRRAWEYVFFVDLLGHVENKTISRVIHDVQDHCEFLKVMGSYPRNDRPR